MNINNTQTKLKTLCSYTDINTVLCNICDDVAQNSVRCKKCGTLYCMECAISIKNKRKKCINNYYAPTLSLPNNSHSLVEFITDEATDEIIKNNLTFCCNRCEYTTKDITEISFHLIDCDSRLVNCPNPYCEFKCNDKNNNNLELHMKECKYFQIKCGVCEYKMESYQEQLTHNCMIKIVDGLTNLEETLQTEKKKLEDYIHEKRNLIIELAKKYSVLLPE